MLGKGRFPESDRVLAFLALGIPKAPITKGNTTLLGRVIVRFMYCMHKMRHAAFPMKR